jgi:glutathione S-transferase
VPKTEPLLILKSTATSPFGRKVKVAAHVLGLTERLRVETADPWQDQGDLRSLNPLGKMPVLVLPDGRSVFDSAIILDCLDMMARPRASIIPDDADARLDALVLQALADGIIEAALLITYETRRRPAEFCYEPWVTHQRGKIERALQHAAQVAPDPTVATVGTITLACALGYLDWRRPLDWRALYPPLVSWLETFAFHVPAFALTKAGTDH